MHELISNHGLFLFLSFLILYVTGVCACYVVGINIHVESNLQCKPRRLFYNCMQWPWFLALMFLHKIWKI